MRQRQSLDAGLDRACFSEGFEVFAFINDPRDGGHTLHHFGEILPTAFAACIAEHLAQAFVGEKTNEIAAAKRVTTMSRLLSRRFQNSHSAPIHSERGAAKVRIPSLLKPVWISSSSRFSTLS